MMLLFQMTFDIYNINRHYIGIIVKRLSLMVSTVCFAPQVEWITPVMSKTNSSRRLYTSFWCAVLFSCLWWLCRPSFDVVMVSAGINQEKSNVEHHETQSSNNAVVLVPGELPGYTGWARLEHTLAGSFQIVSRPQDTAVVGNEWNVTVQCTSCKHNTLHAHFYARAYGPAVLAGNIHEINNTVYTISFFPMDPGSYHVEVVLIASGVPSWNAFPLGPEQDEPAYQGYLLADFPLQLQVLPFVPHTTFNRSCTMSDLLSTTPTSAYYAARWVVVDKVSHPNHVVSAQASRKVTLKEYTSGHQSLGIFMDYRHFNCRLDSFRHANSKLTKYAKTHSNMHVILVGDSTMRLQSLLFKSTFPAIKMTCVSTSGGIVEMVENVTSTLQSLVQDDKNESRYILFNTGLHDINQLCARVMQEERRQSKYILQSDANFSCTAQYQTSLRQLVDFIHQYPAQLKVFMSTTAGWLRYGNFDIEWPPNTVQSAVLSSNMVAHFNEIAYQVVQNFKDIHVLDAYWLSLARPDNRQIGTANNLPKHLVHPGEQVLTAMVNNWIHVLLEHVSLTIP
jgi:hypothetical protein